MFRNYMCNELGITREDIKQWTIEAVATEVAKIVGQVNIQEKIQLALNDQVKSALTWDRFSSANNELRKLLTQQLAEKINAQLNIEITTKDTQP